MATAMTKRSIVFIAALASAGTLHAAPGGKLQTLPRGNYQCGTPGMAGKEAVVVQEDLGFEVVNGSSYLQAGERGTYLHTGKRVVFTSGTMRGARFRRTSENSLQVVSDDGSLGELRCVKLGF